jgi:hypothetical protein
MAAAKQLDSTEPQHAMLITIEELRRWFEEDSATLVNRLQEDTGRYGSDEARVWQRSLQTLTRVFRAPSFQPLHLYFERRGNLALEYQLPAASSWADVVLLGKHEELAAPRSIAGDIRKLEKQGYSEESITKSE